jgi:hypothetical protein
MKTTPLFAALGALLVSVIAGCGGNVTIDQSGTGGSGGEGGGTSGTTVTSPPSYCAALCAQAQQTCDIGDPAACVDGCTQFFAQYPDCNAEIKAIYDCAIADFAVSGCNSNSTACQSQADALTTCAGGNTTNCSTDGCSASGNNDCQCTGSCSGHSIEADCKGTSGAVECSCLVDGQYAGTCKDMELTCDLYNGCCSDYFPL